MQYLIWNSIYTYLLFFGFHLRTSWSVTLNRTSDIFQSSFYLSSCFKRWLTHFECLFFYLVLRTVSCRFCLLLRYLMSWLWRSWSLSILWRLYVQYELQWRTISHLIDWDCLIFIYTCSFYTHEDIAFILFWKVWDRLIRYLFA